MNKLLKRGLSLLLCMSLCMSLYVGVFADTDGNTELNTYHVSGIDAATLGPVLGTDQDQGGIVASWTDFDETGLGYLDIGVYNANQRSAFTVKFEFDSELMDLYSASNQMEIGPEDFGSVYKEDYLSQIPASVMKNNTAPGTDWVTSKLSAPQVLQATPNNMATQKSGTAEVTLEYATMDKTTMETAAGKGKYADGFITGTNLTMGQNEVVSLWRIAFKEKTAGSTIATDTFAFKQATTKRTETTDTITTRSYDVALYNFPKAAAAKRPVTVNVYDGNSSDYLTGAKVSTYATIADRDGESNAIDVLESTSAAATVFQANYEEGQTYYYRVSKNGYKTTDGSFPVTDQQDPAVNVNLLSNTSVQLPTQIKVVNGDTNEMITAGGTLSVGGVSYTIDTDGYVKQGEAGSLKTVELTENTNGYAISNISVTGYESGPTTETALIVVKADAGYNTGTATPDAIRLIPERINVQIPVPLNDVKEGFRPGAQVTIAIPDSDTAAYGKRQAWSAENVKTYMVSEDGTALVNISNNLDRVSLSGTTYPSVKLPADTKFVMSFSATGYSSADEVKVTTKGVGETAAYTDSQDQIIPDITAYTPELTKMSAPLYAVNVKQNESDPRTVTVTVNLSNIASSYGSFGLMYDASVFELDNTEKDSSVNSGGANTNGFQLSDQLELWTPESGYPPVTEEQSAETGIGYHAFTWKVKNADVEGGAVFDTTTAEGAQVASYTFKVRSEKSLDDVSQTSFMLMEYDKTKAARDYLTEKGVEYSEAAQDFFPKFYRYMDKINTEAKRKADTPEDETFIPDYTVIDAKDPEAPTVDEREEYESQMQARLGKDKAEKYINNYNIDADGFYQVFSTRGSRMYDVMSKLTVELTPKKSSLSIDVTDASGKPLPNAAVSLYENTAFNADGSLKEGAAVKGIYRTDATGKVTVTMDGSNSQTFGYKVENAGFWSYPKETTGAADYGKDIKSVSIAAAGVAAEKVVLLDKVYHKAGLWENNPAENKIAGAYNGDLAELGGGEIVYDGTDYVVKIKPAAGYKLNEIPEKIYYTLSQADTDLKDTTTAPGSGIWSSLSYDAAKKGYVMDKGLFTGVGNVSKTADENGFRSDDINIRLDKGVIVEDAARYEVLANAGANGAVTYSKEISADSTAFYPVKDTSQPDNDTPYEEVHRTEGEESSPIQKITIGGIDPKAAQPHVGKFTFTADAGYCVEKVYINGIQVHSYDNLETFEYTGFGAVTTDRDIFVSFWDGETASDELPATLMVGEGGTVSVTAPEPAEADITDGTRKYVYQGTGKLTFTVKPETGNTFEVKQTVTRKDGSRAVSKLTGTGEGEKTFDIAVSKSEEMQDLLVTVTFLKDGVPLTLYVTSYVDSGVGEIDPVGTYAYTYGDAPKYRLEISDSKYIPGNVKVNGEEKAIVKQDSKYSYTLSPQLTEDTEVGAVFVEKSYKIIGAVDWSQGKTLQFGALKSGGLATFTRQSDGLKVTADVTAVRDNGQFEADLPLGVWDLTVTKRGYLNYTVTGFEVTAALTDTTFFGDKTDNTTPKKIVPLIGDTSGKGRVVDLEDAGVVANGLRSGVSENAVKKADVDNDGSVKADTDMAFIKQNYSFRAISIDYSNFAE